MCIEESLVELDLLLWMFQKSLLSFFCFCYQTRELECGIQNKYVIQEVRWKSLECKRDVAPKLYDARCTWENVMCVFRRNDRNLTRTESILCFWRILVLSKARCVGVSHKWLLASSFKTIFDWWICRRCRRVFLSTTVGFTLNYQRLIRCHCEIGYLCSKLDKEASIREGFDAVQLRWFDCLQQEKQRDEKVWFRLARGMFFRWCEKMESSPIIKNKFTKEQSVKAKKQLANEWTAMQKRRNGAIKESMIEILNKNKYEVNEK